MYWPPGPTVSIRSSAVAEAVAVVSRLAANAATVPNAIPFSPT
ncbi:hypothetical protein [Kibdelosporangium philippinense]